MVGRVQQRAAILLGGVLIAAGSLTAVLLRDLGTWDPLLGAALLAFVLATDPLAFTVGRWQVTPGFLGLVIAMALLGPTAAAVIGILATLVDCLRARPRAGAWLINIAAFTWFPLVGGTIMQALAAAIGLAPVDAAFALVVAAGFVPAMVVNVGIAALGLRLLDGTPMWSTLRELFVPLVPSELAMVALASLIVYLQAQAGVLVLLAGAAVASVYLWTLRELLRSEQRGRQLALRTQQLDRRTRELASLQVGVLAAMLKTLSLRDRMTARHSAAVARYSRELAAEAGLSDEQQELVHTAGLLHDIGKFSLPDHILLADRRLEDEDWQLVRQHPAHGAHVVRQVEGYGPVADIVLGHHERVDGRGYPRGLVADAIPLLSRIISIADTYDVLTARDSYRRPLTPAAAATELRRVAGTQLDARLVDLFCGLLERGEVSFFHGDDADFEAELQLERRVREVARPRDDSAAS
jgi:putative nucleotidyltransferase with HDIG domain